MIWLLLILVLPYLFLLVNICRSLLSIRPYKSRSIPSLTVSVVIACRDEENTISDLLDDLCLQDYPRKLSEIIVVDDNSVDNTYYIASGHRQIEGLKVFRNKGKGKKAAIRTGVENAAGALIITTDADCSPGRGWIRNMASFFDENRPDMIIGPVQLKSSSSFFGRFQELEFLSLQGITAGTACSGNPVMCNGANLAFTKDAYYRQVHNMHDEIASGDDIFFLHNLKKDKNSKIMWISSQEAIVTTAPASTLRSFLNQRIRWILKGKAYDDMYTSVIAIVTFITILVIVSSLIAGLFNPAFLPVFFIMLLIKSVPDYLLLKETTRKYARTGLLRYFIPAQIIYPFYVLGVIFSSAFLKPEWK